MSLLIGEAVISIVYFSLFLLLCIGASRSKLSSIIVFLGSFLLLLSLAIANSVGGFIEEKPASFISYNMYSQGISAPTFLMQYIFSYPAFFITENPLSAHAVNLALQSMVFYLSFKYLIDHSPLSMVGLAFLFFPAYYNFAIFGLRDPYINLISVLFIICFVRLSGWRLYFAGFLLALASFLARPEYGVIIALYLAIWFYFNRTAHQKFFLVWLYLLGAYAVAKLIPFALGIEFSGSLVEILQKVSEFNEARNDRRLGGDGSGSHILGGRLYELPFIKRYPIQLTASFLAPLPFEIKGLSYLFAFLESVVFTALAVAAFLNSAEDRRARFLFFFGFIYIAVTAIFASNYGNILRIRYPALIFFVCAYSLGVRSKQRGIEGVDRVKAY